MIHVKPMPELQPVWRMSLIGFAFGSMRISKSAANAPAAAIAANPQTTSFTKSTSLSTFQPFNSLLWLRLEVEVDRHLGARAKRAGRNRRGGRQCLRIHVFVTFCLSAQHRLHTREKAHFSVEF